MYSGKAFKAAFIGKLVSSRIDTSTGLTNQNIINSKFKEMSTIRERQIVYSKLMFIIGYLCPVWRLV